MFWKIVKFGSKSVSEHCAYFGMYFFSDDSKNFERPYLKNWKLEKSENWRFISFRTFHSFFKKIPLFLTEYLINQFNYIIKYIITYRVIPVGSKTKGKIISTIIFHSNWKETNIYLFECILYQIKSVYILYIVQDSDTDFSVCIYIHIFIHCIYMYIVHTKRSFRNLINQNQI